MTAIALTIAAEPEKFSDVAGGAICFFAVLCVALAPIMLLFAEPVILCPSE